MRTSCTKCALKHVGQAMVLAAETVKGYPLYKYKVQGHLAEAEDELVWDYVAMANQIRDMRILYMMNGTPIHYDELIKDLDDLLQMEGVT